MKKIQLFMFVIMAVLLAACSNGSANSSDGKQIELNLSHVLSEDSSFHATASKFAELVEERTSGEVKITIFPAGQLGGEVQSIQALRNGNQDIALTGTPALTATAPEFLALDLPYLFSDLDEANEQLQGPLGEELLDGISKYNIVGLGFHSALERNVFSTKNIEKVEDFKNLKIRVVQADGYINAYEALGAQPTPMPYSEVYLALQQGVIAAGEGSAETMISDKFMEVATHYNLTKTHYYPVVLIMSEASFNKLNEEQQAIVKEAAKEATAHGIEAYKTDYEKSIRTLNEKGIVVTEPSLEEFKKATQNLKEQFISKNPNLSDHIIELLQ